jgi:hypothetical protein
VHCVDDELKGSGADEELALGDDGKLQRRELPLVAFALLYRPL